MVSALVSRSSGPGLSHGQAVTLSCGLRQDTKTLGSYADFTFNRKLQSCLSQKRHLPAGTLSTNVAMQGFDFFLITKRSWCGADSILNKN